MMRVLALLAITTSAQVVQDELALLQLHEPHHWAKELPSFEPTEKGFMPKRHGLGGTKGNLELIDSRGLDTQATEAMLTARAVNTIKGIVRDAVVESLTTSDLPSSTMANTGDGTVNVQQGVPNTDWHSDMDVLSQPYASLVSAYTMSATTSDPDQDYELVLGQGGQIVSFKTSAGQLVPPQFHEDAPWMDEVFQIVGVTSKTDASAPVGFDEDVDSSLPGGAQEFMATHGEVYHQAGSFITNSLTETNPFYSPMVAVQQEADAMSCVNWMQPAEYFEASNSTSDFLSYTKYKDLGSGIIEVTNMLYNSASSGVTMGGISLPYGGIRTSTLQETYYGDSPHVLPKCSFWMLGQSNDLPNCDAINISSTDGYMAFIQAGVTDPNAFMESHVDWIVHGTDPVEDATDHDGIHWNATVFRVRILPTNAEKWSKGMNRKMTLDGSNGGSFNIDGILHTSWIDTDDNMYLYFFPSDGTTVANMNAGLTDAETLSITPVTPGSIDNTLGLGIVFGEDQISNLNSPSTFMVGDSHTGLRRDFSAFSLNVDVRLSPGDAVYWRTFMVVGKMDHIKQQAAALKSHAVSGYVTGGNLAQSGTNLFQHLVKFATTGKLHLRTLDKIASGRRSGTRIYLFSNMADNIHAVAEGDQSQYENDSGYEAVCDFATIYAERQSGSSPVFHVECPSKDMVSKNPYDLIGRDANDILQPYKCGGADSASNTVPVYTLVGFTSDECSYGLVKTS